MQDDAKPDLVVQIARIIDPSSWTVMDSYLEETKRKYRGQNVAWPEDQFQHKESMAKAREILDAIGVRTPAPAQPELVERVEQALKFPGVLENYDVRQRINVIALAKALAAMPVGDGFSKEWCIRMAQLEAGHEISAGAPDHPLRCPPVVDGPPYASDNWDIQGYKSPAEEIDDMANVGRSLIERIASIRETDGPFKGWMPMDDPAEIVTDMANWIAENRATPSADADAGLVEAVQAFFPNIDTGNSNVPDDTIIPLDVTMGELRKLKAALGQGGVR